MSNLRRKFKHKFQEKQNVPYMISGLLGNSSGVVKVPDRNNYVYVRLAGSGVAEVFNNRVQATYDLPVICGYDPVDPQRFQVLSIQGATADAVGSSIVYSTGYAPASRYRWMYPGGGQDPLFVEIRQFMPLRISPTTGLNVRIENQIIWNGTGFEIISNSDTIDLSSYVPTTPDKCKMILIGIDFSGDVIITDGSEVDISALAISDMPTPDTDTKFLIAGMRLYYGQTAIQEARTNTDVVDLRFCLWNAQTRDIYGIEVDLTGITDGNVIKYDLANTKLIAEAISWDEIVNKPLLGPGVLYLHSEASGISTYNDLLEIPSDSAEEEDSQAVVVGDGEVLIDGYISAVLDTTVLPAGEWDFNTYCKVSSVAGDSEIVIRVYRYKSDTTEVELFNTTTGFIDSTDIVDKTTFLVKTDFIVEATDRLLVKYFAKTSSAASVTIYMYHDGSANYSRINVPFIITKSSGSSLTVEEVDESPSVTAVEKIIFPNGSLTDNLDNSVSIEFPTPYSLTVEEIDESPSNTGVTKIIVPNGSIVSSAGGVVTLEFPEGGTGTGETDVLMVQVFS